MSMHLDLWTAGALLLSATAQAAPARAAAVVGPARLGTYIGGGLGLYAPAEVWRNDAARTRELGVGAVRFNSDVWDLLEPSRFDYRWEKLDAAVETMTAAGLEPLFTLPISNKWNGTDKAIKVSGFDIGPTHFPTRDLAGVRALAKTIAARYKTKIKYYEVWNEPDFALFWKGEPNASEYLDLLREAYMGLKEGNPQAVVLLGGLAKPKETEWLDKLLALGGGKFFDVMNLHVYPAFATLEEALGVSRGVMLRHKTSKPIWITETSTTGWYFETSNRNKEEGDKAIYLLKTFAAAMSQPDVERVFWHTLRNPGKDVGLPRDLDFGLMTSDGTPLPAHRALSVFNRLLKGSVPKGRVERPGLEIFPFEDNKRRVEVLWSRKGTIDYRVPSGYKTARRLSLYGEDQHDPGLPASIAVTEEPLYLELLK